MVNIEETTVEITETTNTVDIEALQTQLAEAEEKNKALWDKIYKLKKETKKTETPEAWLSRDELEKFYEEKQFFEKRPEMSEYKEQLNEFTSKWLTFEQAEKLVRDANPDIVARQNTQKSNFTAWTPDFNKSSYSMDDLKNLPQNEYNKVMELNAQGKVNIT